MDWIERMNGAINYIEEMLRMDGAFDLFYRVITTKGFTIIDKWYNLG